jgi:hypothetical protein
MLDEDFCLTYFLLQMVMHMSYFGSHGKHKSFGKMSKTLIRHIFCAHVYADNAHIFPSYVCIPKFYSCKIYEVHTWKLGSR